jgi:hypothetical protein
VSIARLVDETRDTCVRRLASDDLQAVGLALSARHIDGPVCARLLAEVDEAPSTIRGILEIKQDIASSGLPVDSWKVERSLLLGAALHGLPDVSRLRVNTRVQALICDEFRFFASAEPSQLGKSEAGSARFARMAKIATHRRCPAGQFEWEVGGIARRDALRVSPRRLPGTVAFILGRMGGFGPVFFSHLNPRRAQRSLVEAEADHSYFQMAAAMELQPEIRGFAACSWFRSPGVQRVSPNLAWLSRVFLENGGRVVDAGREDPECGVLHRSATRRRLYESGQFTPRRGLVMWPRRDMLAWAAAHPECADPPDIAVPVDR